MRKKFTPTTLASLWTCNCIVRTRDGTVGVVRGINRRTNEVEIAAVDGSIRHIHFHNLIAGDNNAEKQIKGYVTSDFPKEIKPWLGKARREERDEE